MSHARHDSARRSSTKQATEARSVPRTDSRNRTHQSKTAPRGTHVPILVPKNLYDSNGKKRRPTGTARPGFPANFRKEYWAQQPVVGRTAGGEPLYADESGNAKPRKGKRGKVTGTVNIGHPTPNTAADRIATRSKGRFMWENPDQTGRKYFARSKTDLELLAEMQKPGQLKTQDAVENSRQANKGNRAQKSRRAKAEQEEDTAPRLANSGDMDWTDADNAEYRAMAEEVAAWWTPTDMEGKAKFHAKYTAKYPKPNKDSPG